MNIVELAQQADDLAEQKETDKEGVQDFANLVVEECAKVCDEQAGYWYMDSDHVSEGAARDCAAAIRSRGNLCREAADEIERLRQERDELARLGKSHSETINKLEQMLFGEASGKAVDVPCNPDPRAPDGFCRNASHSAGRYVCECEGWSPDE